MRIIGLDPGLQHTGWGIIDQDGSRLSFVAAGRISSVASQPLAERLVDIHAGLIEEAVYPCGAGQLVGGSIVCDAQSGL